MTARALKATVNPVGPIVLFGIDQHGKPQAAHFPADQAGLVSKAAEQLHLRMLTVTDPAVAEIVAQLPAGRIHANGKGAVPNVRADLYAKLLTTAQPPGGSSALPEASRNGGRSRGDGSSLKKPVQHRLPKDWDDIVPGDLVVAHHQEDGCWYEAVVVEQNADLFTLRWREWRWRVARHRQSLALMFADSVLAASETGPAAGQQLAAAASPKGSHAQPDARGLPQSWDEIDVDHLVLAKDDGPWRSWWEAIPTEKHGDMLTLRWRDYAQLPKIERPRLSLALLYPGPK